MRGNGPRATRAARRLGIATALLVLLTSLDTHAAIATDTAASSPSPVFRSRAGEAMGHLEALVPGLTPEHSVALPRLKKLWVLPLPRLDSVKRPPPTVGRLRPTRLAPRRPPPRLVADARAPPPA